MPTWRGRVYWSVYDDARKTVLSSFGATQWFDAIEAGTEEEAFTAASNLVRLDHPEAVGIWSAGFKKNEGS